MKPFLALTPAGRARRLRALALNALRQYPLPVARLRLITNSCNGIFRVDTRAGEKWILRVTLPEGGHTRDHVVAEMDWLAALARDTDLSVPRPRPARDGALVVEASAPGVPEPRLCEVFSWVPGTDLGDHLTPANLEKLGELSARLHWHAATYQPPRALDLLRYDRVYPFPEAVLLHDPAGLRRLPRALRARCRQAEAWAQAGVERLLAGGEPPRILHGDLHPWNVRVARGRLSPIDFEDLMWGWPVQDIATTLYYVETERRYPALRAAFTAGYRRVAPWPERYPGEVDAFIAARALDMLNFALTNHRVLGLNLPRFAARANRRLQRLLAARP